MIAAAAFEAGRVEVAWTVSARAAHGRHGFATAALRLHCEWGASASGSPVPARAEALLVAAAHERAIPLPGPVTATVVRAAGWTHLEIGTAGGVLATASFDHGRLAYCTGAIVELAGLAGGTYDAPTAILECYEPASGTAQAAQTAR